MQTPSRYKGSFEARYFTPFSRKQKGALLQALDRLILTSRYRFKRSRAITETARDVVKALCHVIDFKSGRCDPSLDGLMKLTRRSRGAIVQALKALRKYGLIDWIRRFEIQGGQYAQRTNAYKLLVPSINEKQAYTSLAKIDFDNLPENEKRLKVLEAFDQLAAANIDRKKYL